MTTVGTPIGGPVEAGERELLYESPRSAVWREHATQGSVIVKAPSTAPIHEFEHRYYRRAEAVARAAEQLTPRTTLELRRGVPHLVMADHRGRTVEQVAADRAVGFSDRLDLAVRAADTLMQFHDLGFVHGDLTASNLLITDDSQLLLLDLESAVGTLDEDLGEPHRRAVAPTPENQSTRGVTGDPRSDLYALGLVLHRLFGGADPFQGLGSAQVAARLGTNFEPEDSADQQTPPVVRRIIARLLTAVAGERYQSCGILARDLRRCLNALSVSGTITDFEIANEGVSPALDLEVRLVGRDRQLGALAELVASSAAQRGPHALIAGPPGSGKSELLRSFATDIAATGAVIAYGKIEPGQSKPYAALASALSQVVLEMLGARTIEFEAWQVELQATLQTTGKSLTALLPDLNLVLDELDPIPDLDGAGARNRLHRAMSALLQATATVRPVVLLIDDLQWADSDTELALRQFSLDAPRNYVFIGAHRLGEYDQWETTFGDQTVRIDLPPLAQSDVASMLRDALGKSAAQAEISAVVFERTAGNPLFVKQLVRRAQQEGALRYEAIGARWVWDRQKLAQLEAADNVVDLLVESIELLSERHAAALSCIACIGGSFSLTDAIAASDETEADVAEALWSALELRLIESEHFGRRGAARVLDQRSRYRFSHDRVAEAAQSRLSGEQRQAAHLRYGRRLNDQPEPPRFEVAHHLNEGLMLVDDPVERLEIARLNLEVAQLAADQSAFPLALDSYEAGISLLGAAGWHQHPELTGALHVGAAQTSLLIGDLDRAHEWLDTASPQLIQGSFEAARIAYIRMKALVADHRLQEAVEVALDALVMLDIEVTAEPSKAQAAAALVRARVRLRRWSDDQLLNLPICDDPATLEAERILAELMNIAYLVRPELFPLVVTKAIELTLRNGLLSISAVGFANYGLLMIVAFNGFDDGRRWGALGLTMSESEPCQGLKPWVEFVFYNFISHWHRPMRESLEPLLDAHRRALQTGNTDHAGWAATVLIYQSFNLGLPLTEVDSVAERLIPTFHAQRVQTRLSQSTQQLCLNLMGRAEEPFLLAGESGFDEREVLTIAEAEGDIVAISATAMTKLGLHFWFGDFEGAIEQAEIVEQHLDGMSGTPNVPTYHLINALSRLFARPHDRATSQAARRASKLYKKWASRCVENYGAQRAYLDGVRDRVAGNTSRAEEHLDRAVSLADEHRLPQYAALAREELGELYLEAGRTSLARTFLRDAYDQWHSIEMTARIDRLADAHPWIDHAPTGTAMSTIEVQSVLEISQALSSEIQLDKLLSRLVDSACDLTAATRAMLFTSDDARPRCRVRRDNDNTVVLADTDAEVAAPFTIVRYVERTGRPLRLDDASASSHSADPYVRDEGTKACLCIPIRIRDQIVAVLYLENGHTAGAFSIDHQQLLMMLSGQIGASLENAQLVDQLEEALDSQTALTTAQSRFIPDEFLQLFGRDDITSVQVGETVQRRLTILISDIRGYTRLVEQLSLAEAGEIAIDFLRSVEPSIIGNNGFVQDMRGDEVLALFGRSADDAVQAGLAMQRSQLALNERRTSAGGPVVRAGIGITTGDVMLSMVGGVNRMTPGVIGDAVNLASRIESLNKRYGSGVLIGDTTAAALTPGRFATRRMERVRVVNRSEPVTVFEVYDDDAPALFDLKQKAAPAFNEAFALFDGGDFGPAADAFARCKELLPDDGVADLHYGYCTTHRDGASVIDLRVTELTGK